MTAAQGEAQSGGAEDGRHARSRRSRDAVLDAFLEEAASGQARPTVEAVAARAGVSPRSVFRHFKEYDLLFDAAMARQIERLAPLAALPQHEDSLAGRIGALVSSRSALNEALIPVRRVVQSARLSNPHLDGTVRRGGELLRAQIAFVFAGDLAPLEADERSGTLSALEGATSWPTWNHLRYEQCLGVDASRAVVHRLVAGVMP